MSKYYDDRDRSRYGSSSGGGQRPSTSRNDVQRLTSSMAKTSLSSSTHSRSKSAPSFFQDWSDLDKYDPKLYDEIMYASKILKRTRFRPFQPTFPRWSLAASAPARTSAPAKTSAPRPSASGSGSSSRSKVYPCNFCDRDYSSKEERNRHEEDRHYACRYCGKKRRDREDQRSHESRCKR